MADKLASLKIAIESGDIKRAQDELNKLATQAGTTERKFDSFGQSVGKLMGSLASLKTLIAGAGIFAVGKEYADVADKMNNLAARIKLVSSAGQDLHKTQSDLLKIANENKVSIESVGKLYVKLAEPMRQLGANTQTTMDVTNAFSKALLVGGASTEEATSATLQFAQAMGSGVLRGDEFNSIAEASPRILKAVADSLGVTSGKLREMAADGKLTAGVISGALLRSMTELEAEAVSMPNTVGGAFQILKNNVSDMVYKFDEATGVSGELATAINDLSDETSSLTKNVIADASALKQWIRDNQAGINTIKESTSSIVKFGVGVASVMGAQILGNLSRGTKIIGEVGKATGIVNEQGKSTNQIAEETAKKNKSKNATLEETLRLEKELKNLSLPKEEQKKLEVASKKSVAMEKMYKAYLSTGKSISEVTSLMVAQDKLYDERIKMASKLEASGKPDDKKKTKKGKTDAEKEAEKEAERIKKLEEELKDLRIKNSSDAIKATMEDEAKAYQDLILKRDKELEKFKGIKGAELEINKEFNLEVDGLNKKLVENQTKIEKEALDEKAKLQADAALSFYALVQSETDKINEANLLLLDANKGLWSDEQMQTFYSKWQESIDGVKGGYAEILDEIDKLAPTSKDWTAGLTGQAKQIANIVNATTDLTKVQKSFNKEREKINSSKELSNGQKQVALKKLETTELDAQYYAYSNLAGAMASAFKEGSDGAIAFTTLQSALGIASSWTAIAEAWALGFPQNIPAVAMVTSAVMPIIGQLGGSSGGGSSSTPPAAATMGTVLGGGAYGQSESITNITDMMKDIHVSEYAQLRDINKAVTSMAHGIEGAVTNLFRSGATDTSGVKLSSSGDTSIEGSLGNIFKTGLAGGAAGAVAGSFLGPIGTVIGGIVGTAAGSAIGLVKSLIGSSTRQELRASGIDISAGSLASKQTGAGLGASSYVDIETVKRKAWGSTSYSYNKQNTALDEATSNSISLIYQSFDDTMKEINKGLGAHLEKTINDYQFQAVSLNLKGLTGDEATKKLNDMFSSQGDRMVTDIFGTLISQYQKLGEGLLESAVRVITEKEVALQQLGDIGFNNITGDLIATTQALIGMSGGLDKFMESNRAYYDNYFTDSEKQANSLKNLTAVFTELEIPIPATTTAFREMVSALDITNSGGQKTYTSLMEVSGAFYDMAIVVEEANKKIVEEHQGLQETYDLLTGVTTQRGNELKALDPSNRVLQERIWAIEDETAATEKANALIATSTANIKSFTEGLLTPTQNAKRMVEELGGKLPTNISELATLAKQLAFDTDGLTNADLAAINASKSLLVSQYDNTDAIKTRTTVINDEKKALDDYLGTITKNISTLEGTLSSFQSTIDSLRGSAIGSSYTLDMYRKSMSETLALSGTSDYEAFSTSLQNTIGYSSVLSESAMYQTAAEMKFAQAVAANQFESMQVKTLSQIDYLKLIEKNTKDSSDRLAESLTTLNSTSTSSNDMLSIMNQQLAALLNVKAVLTEQWTTEGTKQTYVSSGGAVATQQVGATDYMITSLTGASFSGQTAIDFVNNAIASGDLMSIYTAAIQHGISSTSLDRMMRWDSGTSLNWALSKGLKPFSAGGYTGDMPINNIAGVVHGKEYVINAQTTKDLGLNNSAGVFQSILSELSYLRNLTTTIASSSVKTLSTQRAILGEIAVV